MTHGGKRIGSGRKKLEEKKERMQITIMVTADERKEIEKKIEYLRVIEGKNLSDLIKNTFMNIKVEEDGFMTNSKLTMILKKAIEEGNTRVGSKHITLRQAWQHGFTSAGPIAMEAIKELKSREKAAVPLTTKQNEILDNE